MKNILIPAILTVALAFSTTVSADTITFKLGAGNDDVNKSGGLLDSLSLVAEDAGSGVLFTFRSAYDLGDPNHAGGAGKIHDNSFFVFNTHDVFSGGDGVTTGGNLNGASYVGSDIKLGTADFTAVTSGYTYSLIDDLWTTSFTLDYADNGFTWDDFINILADPIGSMELQNAFTIGIHLQALENGNSAKVVTFVAEVPPAATPEPGTMLIFGLGAAGFGGLVTRRRRNLKKVA